MPLRFMSADLTGRCQRLERNNGIIKALFTCPSQSKTDQQDELVLVNVHSERGEFEDGARYEIVIRRAKE